MIWERHENLGSRWLLALAIGGLVLSPVGTFNMLMRWPIRKVPCNA